MDKFFYFIFLLIVSLAPYSAAADSAFVCRSGGVIADSAAANFEAKAEGAYSKLASFRAEFKQDSYLATLDASEQSSGAMWFKKPGQMRWNYREPEEQQFVMRNQTLWFYQKADNQVLVDDFKKVLLQDVPVSFLLGVGSLTENFSLARACYTESGILLELQPKNAKAAGGDREDSLRSLKLLIDEKSFLPLGAEVKDSALNLTSIKFYRRIFDEPLSDDLFAAKFPKDADLIDRRKNS